MAFEEADEPLDWLEYLRDSNIREDTQLLNEALELSNIRRTLRCADDFELTSY